MAWTDARDRIIAIIKDTTPTSKKMGANLFQYAPKATRRAPNHLIPDTRGFWFEVESITTKRLIRAGGLWEIARVRILFSYARSLEEALRLELQMQDRAAVCRRLLDPSLWNRSTSTIEKIAHEGEDELFPTTFDGAIDGTDLMVGSVRVEFTTS